MRKEVGLPHWKTKQLSFGVGSEGKMKTAEVINLLVLLAQEARFENTSAMPPMRWDQARVEIGSPLSLARRQGLYHFFVSNLLQPIPQQTQQDAFPVDIHLLMHP